MVSNYYILVKGLFGKIPGLSLEMYKMREEYTREIQSKTVIRLVSLCQKDSFGSQTENAPTGQRQDTSHSHSSCTWGD